MIELIQLSESTKTTSIDIHCPNCDMSVILAKDTQPPVFTTCRFCETKFKWDGTVCHLIVPASQQHYLNVVLHMDSN